MLDIRIENTSLDLGKVSITFELNSPIFNSVGSFSYPFTLPATAKNKKLLNFPARINNNIAPGTHAAEIYIDGLIWKRGNLVVKESDRDTIKAYFTVGEGYFYNQIKDLKLKDLDLGGERITDNYSHDNLYSEIYNNKYPDVDFAIFELRNSDFWLNTDHEIDFRNLNYNTLNYWDTSNKLNISKNTFVFYPYVNYLLDRIVNYFDGSFIENEISTDTKLKQLCLYSNNPQNDIQYIGDYLNILQKPTYLLNDSLPDVSVLEFIKSIEETFAATLFYNDNDGRFSIKLFKTIIDSEALKIDNSFVINSVSPNDWEGYTVAWNNDPDDKLIEDYVRDISIFNFIGSVNSFSQLPITATQGDMYFVESFSRYFVWSSWSFGGYSWNFASNAFSQIISGIGSKSITPFGSLYYSHINETNDDQKVGNHLLGEGYKDFPIRFLFYRGMINQKPVGGSTTHNIPFPAYGIHWHGDTGLYENFWKKPLEFFSRTRQGEFKMVLDAATLKNIDFSRKYRFANANWLLSNIKIQVTNDGISPAQITAWKV